MVISFFTGKKHTRNRLSLFQLTECLGEVVEHASDGLSLAGAVVTAASVSVVLRVVKGWVIPMLLVLVIGVDESRLVNLGSRVRQGLEVAVAVVVEPRGRGLGIVGGEPRPLVALHLVLVVQLLQLELPVIGSLSLSLSLQQQQLLLLLLVLVPLLLLLLWVVYL